MTFWLKMIGTKGDPWPREKTYSLGHVDFRGRKPNGVHPGDRMILYAVHWKCIFAVVDVISDPRDNDQDDWPYRVDIGLPEISLAPSNGIDAANLIADVKKRVMRRSHLKLTRDEFGLAAQELRRKAAKCNAPLKLDHQN